MKLQAFTYPFLVISFALSDPCTPSSHSTHKGPVTPQKTDIVFDVATVLPRFVDQPFQVEASGVFSASDRLMVQAPLAGQVEKVLVAEGDKVNAGDVLCQLKSDEVNLEISAKQAELKASEAQLDNDQKSMDMHLSQVAQKEKDNVFLDDDQVPDKTIPKPTGPADSPQNNPPVPNPSSGATTVEVQDWPSKIRVDQAKIEWLQKELDQLDLKQKQLSVTAGIAGLVQKRLATEGATVEPGAALFEIVNLNPITLTFKVPAKATSYVDKQIPVKASPVGSPEILLDGSIFFISSGIDPLSQTLEVKGHFANENGQLKEGQAGVATLITRKVDKVLVVPKKALVQAAAGNSIFIMNGYQAHKVDVVLLKDFSPEEIEIDADIRVDDPVIVAGQQSLKEGSFVKQAVNAPLLQEIQK